ncbi:hypothetical protein [Clostridium sp.]|jgi:rsbT antagonist protein RsbS|uniref:hypothetical protein n=1 Tax=Clostridium sp. TaxID=1506 RepID=UPI002FDD8B7C
MENFNKRLTTSVTAVKGCLIVNLPKYITDYDVKIGSRSILMKANNSYIRGTILDFSMVSILDSHSFKACEEVSQAISLMGVQVIWIGIRPGIVSALMDLDLDVTGVKTAVNLEHAIKMISNF